MDLPEATYLSAFDKTTPAGYNDRQQQPGEDPPMSFSDNFRGFWRTWRADVITRDYKELDRIHPKRMDLEAWLRATGYDGKRTAVLKNLEDGKTRPVSIVALVWTAMKGVVAYYRAGGVDGFKKSILKEEQQQEEKVAE